MNPRHNKSVTLVELLIAVSIFSLIVIGFSSIDTFSRYHVVNSDRRVKLQNDASYVLEHMAKVIGTAIGDLSQQAVTITPSGSDTIIVVWTDYNENGKRESYPTDRPIAYQYSGTPNYQMRYYPDYSGSPGSYDVISRKISSFSSSYSSSNDYLEVYLTACWDPDGSPVACGRLDNPELVMKNRISMPAVSTH